jgi:hypothetical protein
MAWNGPVNGDYSKCDFSKPPWTAGLAVLTHDEVCYVQDTIENEIRPNYKPQIGEPAEPSDFWLQSEYNKFVKWEKGINGDTYGAIKGYDRTAHVLGINESGIVQPIEEKPQESEV